MRGLSPGTEGLPTPPRPWGRKQGRVAARQVNPPPICAPPVCVPSVCAFLRQKVHP
jgi:hypothetical protein